MSNQQDQPIIIQQPYSKSSFTEYSNPLTNQYIEQNYATSNHTNNKESNEVNQINKQSINKNISESTFYQVLDEIDQYDELIQQMNFLYSQGMLAIANVKFLNPYTSMSTKGFKPTPAITKISINTNYMSQNRDQQAKIVQTQQNNMVKQEQTNKQKYKIFTLVDETGNKNLRFTYSAIQSINRNYNDMKSSSLNNQQTQDQHQLQQVQQPLSQSGHSSRSTNHNLYSYEQQQQIIQQEQTTQECRKLAMNCLNSGQKCQEQKQDKARQQFLLNRFNIQSQKPLVIQVMNHFQALLYKLLQIAQAKIKIQQKFSAIKQKKQNIK